MKKLVGVLFAIGLVVSVTVSAIAPLNVSAADTKVERVNKTIPKQFRGTWYQYKNGRYYKLKVTAKKAKGKTSIEPVNMKMKAKISANKIFIGSGSGPAAPVSYLTYNKAKKTLKYTLVGDGGYRKSVTLYKSKNKANPPLIIPKKMQGTWYAYYSNKKKYEKIKVTKTKVRGKATVQDCGPEVNYLGQKCTLNNKVKGQYHNNPNVYVLEGTGSQLQIVYFKNTVYIYFEVSEKDYAIAFFYPTKAIAKQNSFGFTYE
ncbi:hypothetical protein EQG49_04045 [Periweissella cryptocerci]|uniref:Uncharacterized protein n=1 Tax=Periweissella cryptocerci TaxID=2506420 RepID=A0A4P6YSJ8_9LACO|nr:hypothetical protein [Periweissella cryptocerci]QBO35689.1 hypothetical protein EQG49_04045 [Periweissella cryptocerci]